VSSKVTLDRWTEIEPAIFRLQGSHFTLSANKPRFKLGLDFEHISCACCYLISFLWFYVYCRGKEICWIDIWIFQLLSKSSGSVRASEEINFSEMCCKFFVLSGIWTPDSGSVLGRRVTTKPQASPILVQFTGKPQAPTYTGTLKSHTTSLPRHLYFLLLVDIDFIIRTIFVYI